jgi:aryl-alcohol dehydrogenase-like predicted oxidoreductase
MADVGLRPTVPGADDNLSGVAGLLCAARALAADPPQDRRVLLLSTGAAESFLEGMIRFGERHFARLPARQTWLLCLESVGSPALFTLDGEGFLRLRRDAAGPAGALAAEARRLRVRRSATASPRATRSRCARRLPDGRAELDGRQQGAVALPLAERPPSGGSPAVDRRGGAAGRGVRAAPERRRQPRGRGPAPRWRTVRARLIDHAEAAGGDAAHGDTGEDPEPSDPRLRRDEPRAGTSRAMASLGRTGLDVFPLCLGGNVFGWTADEPQSHAILDAYTAAGGNFVDTANSYLVEHGRSETIIGRWLAARDDRHAIVLATKVGGGRGAVRNLRAETIEREAHASLERLQTDRIDLYYAHFDDEQTPLEETLRAFDALVQAGVVRHLGASNYSPERLTAALELQREHGLAEFTVLQPHYNLVERDAERTLLPVADGWDLAVLPYYGLAKGFLTGKYRPGGAAVESQRAEGARAYLERGGAAVLEALDEVAAAHDTTVAAVALAWLRAHPRVVAPIASARTTEQLEQILPSATLELTDAEIDRLSGATAPV